MSRGRYKEKEMKGLFLILICQLSWAIEPPPLLDPLPCQEKQNEGNEMAIQLHPNVDCAAKRLKQNQTTYQNSAKDRESRHANFERMGKIIQEAEINFDGQEKAPLVYVANDADLAQQAIRRKCGNIPNCVRDTQSFSLTTSNYINSQCGPWNNPSCYINAWKAFDQRLDNYIAQQSYQHREIMAATHPELGYTMDPHEMRLRDDAARQQRVGQMEAQARAEIARIEQGRSTWAYWLNNEATSISMRYCSYAPVLDRNAPNPCVVATLSKFKQFAQWCQTVSQAQCNAEWIRVKNAYEDVIHTTAEAHNRQDEEDRRDRIRNSTSSDDPYDYTPSHSSSSSEEPRPSRPSSPEPDHHPSVKLPKSFNPDGSK